MKCVLPTKCSIGAELIEGTEECVCSDDKSHDNGYECVSCEHPSFWNEDKNSCDQCQDSYFYNSVNEEC